MVAAAKASKCIVQIGFQRRAHPRFIESMRLVHSGEIGKIMEAGSSGPSPGDRCVTGAASGSDPETGWSRWLFTTGMS